MEWPSPASSVGLHYFFFPLGFLCEYVCETTWIRNFVFKWGPKFRMLHPSLEMDKNNKKSLVFFSMEISWPWELSRFWMWNVIFVSIKTCQNFLNHNLQQKPQIFCFDVSQYHAVNMVMARGRNWCSQVCEKIWQMTWVPKAEKSVISPNVMTEDDSSGGATRSALSPSLTPESVLGWNFPKCSVLAELHYQICWQWLPVIHLEQS